MKKSLKTSFPREILEKTALHIAESQTEEGAIPWFRGGHIDAWNHTEALMGLAVCGYLEEAEAALDWLQSNQLDNGAWLSSYGSVKPSLDRIETNFVAYPSVGLWHFYLVTGKKEVLERYWPTIQKAIGFVLDHQSPYGEITWETGEAISSEPDALVTGNSSIYKSIECGIRIARLLGKDSSQWEESRHQIGIAIRNKPQLFDRTWHSKSRYSMDWFYPILCGVHKKQAAKNLLRAKWKTFVESDKGCRCVADEPWITAAETSELAITLASLGLREDAVALLTKILWHQDCDGGWWTGHVYLENIFWPPEKPTWTGAAVILAIDAIEELTDGHRLFKDHL